MTRTDKVNESKFWVKVDKSDGCWIWKAYRDKDGYGVVRVGNRTMLAHRVSYYMANNGIKDSLCVCHKCDNPPCVNPAHLFLASRQENMDDMTRKGRAKPNKKRGSAHYKAILNEALVLKIREVYKNGNVTIGEIAEIFGLTPSGVGNAIYGKTWTHI